MALTANRSALVVLAAVVLAGCPGEQVSTTDAEASCLADAGSFADATVGLDAATPADAGVAPDAAAPLPDASGATPDAAEPDATFATPDADGPAAWDGGSGWDAGACVPFSPTGKSWTTREIAFIGGAPMYPHVRVGPDDVPVAVFTKAKDSATRYAAVSRFVAGAWTAAETVETVNGSSFGKRPSLAIGSDGTLHVLAYDETGLRPRYSQKPPQGTWTSEALYDPRFDAGDSSALAFDPAGKLHATFLKYGTYNIIHAVKEASGWTYEAIQAAGAAAPVRAGSASLAIDGAGQPHVAMMAGTTTNTLAYALRAQGAWTVETVDPTAGTGHYSNIALDLGGAPHIVALRWPLAVSDVRVASRVGGTWTVEPVAEGLGTTYTTGLAIACDTQLVAFARNGGTGTGGLWFGYRMPADAQWTLVSVDSSVDVSGIDLTIGRDGRVHLVYLDETNYVLRHAMLQ